MFTLQLERGLAHGLKSDICRIRATIRYIRHPIQLFRIIRIEVQLQRTAVNRGRR
jgi:hypothetical protein